MPAEQVAIFLAVAILAVSAYPIHRDPREATWTDSKANQAHSKSQLTKEADKLYKSRIDHSALYSLDDDFSKDPLSMEIQRKLLMESERLRERLRHELADLRARLAPSQAQLSSAVTSVRGRLTPLTQELRNSSHDLCQQLRVYLRIPDPAEGKPDPVVRQWMVRALEQGGSRLNEILAQTREVTEHPMGQEEVGNARTWEGFSSKLGQEVISMKEEAQNSLNVLRVELAKSSGNASPLGDAVERFCQTSAQQNQAFQTRMESLLREMEEELEIQSSPFQAGGSLQEDFSVQLSALIQDILHSVQ
ncbi:uncharacterized protein LOC144083206 [Stigmatopora argus]